MEKEKGRADKISKQTRKADDRSQNPRRTGKKGKNWMEWKESKKKKRKKKRQNTKFTVAAGSKKWPSGGEATSVIM